MNRRILCFGDSNTWGFDPRDPIENRYPPEERWPDLLAQATGIQLDSRDVLDDTVAFIGLDTLRTAREVWADIAAAQGGNAILTPEGRTLLGNFLRKL